MDFKRFTDLDIERFLSYSEVLDLSTYVTGNNLYRAKAKGRFAYIYKTPEATEFQKEIEDYISSLSDEIKQKIFCCKLTILYSSEWFFKNGSLKRIDLTNITKVVEDAICKALGVDDSLFYKSELEKVIPLYEENPYKKMSIIFNIDFYKKRM